MLQLGSFTAKHCGGVSRRAFVSAGLSFPFAAALGGPSLLAAGGKGEAKSTIFVWLWGAPSHLDTFDPKPDAPAAYRGPFATIATRTPSVRFSELVPRLAARSDRFSLVRTNISHADAHPSAGTLGLTGYPEDAVPAPPAFGSIAARHRESRGLPPYVMLGRGVPRDIQRPVSGFGGGDWGRGYDPFLIGCNDSGEVNVPSLTLLEGLSPERLADRRTVTEQLDRLKASAGDGRLDDWDRSRRQAHDLLFTSSAATALDLSQEKEGARAAYGWTAFGQSLLLARRLAEAGTPFIHVNWSEYVEALTPNTDFGWDTHIHNFDLLPTRHCPIFDRAFSALLDDLDERGLMDQTLVVCLGEFGRTPKINKRASRDHWPQCFFSLWAGAGIRAGRVIGKSDKLGEHPATRPIQPQDVGVTIMDRMGIDSIARAELNVLKGSAVIEELL